MENEGKTLATIKAKRDKMGVSEHMQDLIKDRWKAVDGEWRKFVASWRSR